MAVELENGKVLCEQCGEDFKQIGQHWTGPKECSHPEISQNKKEIIIGLLMGDGTIGAKNSKNQWIKISMVSPNYLEYVDNQLGWLSTGVVFAESSEDLAERNRRTGFSTTVNEENYSDVYSLRTRSHPFVTSLTEWYSSGSKVWPEDIKLTPTVLKHWYCCDGHYGNKNGNNRIAISMANEIENTEKVSNYFTKVGLPHPSNYSVSKRKDGSKRCSAFWTVEDSQNLFEYMGESLPDFEYKWPN